ncbi:MAG TPA: heme-binding protein [Gaiellaceae bacterium]|nr:heme-binding protein [Gaiellaceae bacterium]
MSEQAVEDPQAEVADSAVVEPAQNGAAAGNGVVEELPVIALPARFEFNQVDQVHLAGAAAVPAPSLGAIKAFKGTFTGNGFNTIFRPHEPGSDNVLELNLTHETLAFSPSLGSVPNRGMVQADVFLNGIPYLQTISDVTTGVPVGIHAEPGLWMAVPSTIDPKEGQTYTRMASIPHGTTINAQGTAKTISGPPTIPTVDITPFVSSSQQKIPFPSQHAGTPSPDRIPQNLAGTGITQAMLDDPNSVLRHHIAGQHIVSTTIIHISTSPHAPLFGGGSDNIAFLLGFPGAPTHPNASGQNAQAIVMHATFWIETVEHTVSVPPIPAPIKSAGGALEVKPEAHGAGAPLPTFAIQPPHPEAPQPITVKTKQIQYSQTVILNFNGLSWPHVSVATLVPAHPIAVQHTP